jgi:hypothetical protein
LHIALRKCQQCVFRELDAPFEVWQAAIHIAR